MCDLLALTPLFPIAWAIISTILGLALYKTSRAFFSDTTKTRQIRLYGSVVIALVFFWLMSSTTRFVPEGYMLVSTHDVEELNRLAQDMDSTAMELQGCVQTVDRFSYCQEHAEQNNSQSELLHHKITALLATRASLSKNKSERSQSGK